MNWIELGVAFGSGTVIQYVVTYINSKRTNNRDDFSKIVETWQHDNERLRSENEKLERELHVIRLELNELRAKVILMESAHSDAPLPMWLKDTKGIILSVNRSYEETFLIPLNKTANDYIGNTDFAVWPPEIAAQFQKNDSHVLKTGKPWRGVEEIQTETGIQKWNVLKYVRYAGTIKLGVAGIAIPINWDET